MNFALPTGSLGRILALGILIVLVLVLWLGVVAPLAALYDSRADELAQRRTLAARMTAAAAALPALQAQAEKQADTVRPPNLLLDGATDALAAAALQEALEKDASSAGVVLLSAEGVPVQNVGAVRRIGLKVNLSGKFAATIGFLQRITQTEPPLLVDELQIQGSPAMNRDQAATDLLTGMAIYGFRAGGQRN